MSSPSRESRDFIKDFQKTFERCCFQLLKADHAKRVVALAKTVSVDFKINDCSHASVS